MHFLRLRTRVFGEIALMGGLVVAMPVPPAHGQQPSTEKDPFTLVRECGAEIQAQTEFKFHLIPSSRGYRVLTPTKTAESELCRFDYEGKIVEGVAGRPSCNLGVRIHQCMQQKK